MLLTRVLRCCYSCIYVGPEKKCPQCQRSQPWHEMLTKEQCLHMFETLSEDGLVGAAMHYLGMVKWIELHSQGNSKIEKPRWLLAIGWAVFWWGSLLVATVWILGDGPCF